MLSVGSRSRSSFIKVGRLVAFLAEVHRSPWRDGSPVPVTPEPQERTAPSEPDAHLARFAGSPTVRVDGHDVEPGSEPATEHVLGCRLYRLEHRFAGQPEEPWVREALQRAAGPD
jgi:hypothetical protein